MAKDRGRHTRMTGKPPVYFSKRRSRELVAAYMNRYGNGMAGFGGPGVTVTVTERQIGPDVPASEMNVVPNIKTPMDMIEYMFGPEAREQMVAIDKLYEPERRAVKCYEKVYRILLDDAEIQEGQVIAVPHPMGRTWQDVGQQGGRWRIRFGNEVVEIAREKFWLSRTSAEAMMRRRLRRRSKEG